MADLSRLYSRLDLIEDLLLRSRHFTAQIAQATSAFFPEGFEKGSKSLANTAETPKYGWFRGTIGPTEKAKAGKRREAEHLGIHDTEYIGDAAGQEGGSMFAKAWQSVG